jgi:hypothetical protein
MYRGDGYRMVSVSGNQSEARKGCGSTAAKTPPRPCSAVSSANRGACTRLQETNLAHEIARLRHPHLVRLSPSSNTPSPSA